LCVRAPLQYGKSSVPDRLVLQNLAATSCAKIASLVPERDEKKFNKRALGIVAYFIASGDNGGTMVAVVI
jgi:hypothetical protein